MGRIQIPATNGPIDPPSSSLTSTSVPVSPNYADAFDDDESSVKKTPRQSKKAKTNSNKPLAKSENLSTSAKPAKNDSTKSRASKTVSKKQASTTVAEPPPTTETISKEKESASESLSNGLIHVPTLIASSSDSIKELGIKLAVAQKKRSKDPETEQLKQIPAGTPENPEPWVKTEGQRAGLKPIPPKGEAPFIQKKQETETVVADGKKREATPSRRKGRASSAQSVSDSNKKGALKTVGLMQKLVHDAETGIEPLKEAAPEKPAPALVEEPEERDPDGCPVPSADEDDPRRMIDDGTPTGLVEDIVPKRYTAREIEALPGRHARTAVMPHEENDDLKEDPAVSALYAGDWLRETASSQPPLMSENDIRAARANEPRPRPSVAFEAEEAEYRSGHLPAQPPQPQWDDARGDYSVQADYAMRMHAWEQAVLATDLRKGIDIPDQVGVPTERIPLNTGTNSTIGGFPTPEPVRNWRYEGQNEPTRQSDRRATRDEIHRVKTRLAGLLRQFREADGALRLAFGALLMVATAVTASILTVRLTLPDHLATELPSSSIAVVREDEIRQLMVLANLLESRGITAGRVAPRLSAKKGSEESTKTPGLLKDEHWHAALSQASNLLGLSIFNASSILATPAPDVSTQRTPTVIDATETVKACLGLSQFDAEVARLLLEQELKTSAPTGENKHQKELHR